MSTQITDVFTITGRGTVLVVDEFVVGPVGEPIQVRIETPDGEMIEALAFKEYLLISFSGGEKVAFVVAGVSRAAVPIGSTIEVRSSPA